ncbi:MAG: MBL fold metallo-hydrolase [Alphaproteobacteria bacterium]|nr:MBL fold metallo-hydrolase [Alphaproteobacteria bacterium]
MSRSHVAAALGLAALGTACTPIDMMARGAASYFGAWDEVPVQLVEVAEGVFAFEHHMERALVLHTADGLVVVDPFNEEVATLLRAALDARFPWEPVTHLIYSHQHLDHTRGGGPLEPQEVWAHENTAWHFERYGEGEVLLPTRYLPAGDQSLELGGVRVELLDFPNAHADHLYGVHLPDVGVLYGSDLAFCHTLPPFGFPDFNYAGMVEALERAESLAAPIYVPSHFERGTATCVTEYKQLMIDGREAGLRALAKHGLPSSDPAWFAGMLKDMEADLEPRYGDWRGWDEMHIPFLTRNLSGSYLGF